MNIRLHFRAIAIQFIILAAAHAQSVSPDELHVPSGFTVERASLPGLTNYPMFMAFDTEGRLFIAESTGKDLSGKEMAAAPECQILRLEDHDRDGIYDTRTVFAENLSLPMGVLWHQNRLFVASPPDLLAFDDLDADGVADNREVILTGWNVLNTASLHGPFLGPDGWLYLTHGRHGYKIQTKEGPVLEGMAARIWRCRPDGTGLERFAGGGFDNPVELIFTNAGEMIGTMTYYTDPRQGQRDALLHFVEGGVYPKPHSVLSEFVRTGDLMPAMTRFARIAPAGLLRYRSGAFGADYVGDLFSAQFNPHRIQRHKLIREGATFRTEDSDFLSSTNTEFYPTDVLEDADGSMLVSDTGAWYVDACPISRVAKPEIKGGIYRIRKLGSTRPADPWGTSIDWRASTPTQLAALLADPRIKVQDRALEELVARGNDSISALTAVTNEEKPEPARFAAISALVRIDGEAARAALRELVAYLHSREGGNPERAAWALGTLKDHEAIPQLVTLITDPDPNPAVRREAATALARTATHDRAAFDALLAATARPMDRFEDHAVIHALLQSDFAHEAKSALANANPNTRRAALIVADQTPAANLTAPDVLPLLSDPDAEVRRTALWAASRHEDWAPQIATHLAARLQNLAAEENPDGLRDILLAYAANPVIQEAIANALAVRPILVDEYAFPLDLVSRAAVSPVPDSWIDALDALLKIGHLDTTWRVLRVIRARGIDTLDSSLTTIIDNPDAPADLRLEALDIRLARTPVLTNSQFDLALSALETRRVSEGRVSEEPAPDTSNDPITQQKAAKALARAQLTPAQLQTLAKESLPSADALTLPLLLPAFNHNTDPTLASLLIQTLDRAPDIESLLTTAQLDQLLAPHPDAIRAAAAPLRARIEANAADRIERLRALEPQLGSGDVGRGRAIFFGPKAACSTCHTVGGEGGALGPDLTTVGLVRSGHDLLEAVLFPNASIVQDYEPYVIQTPRGMFSGVIAEETPASLLLKTGVNEEFRIQRDEITSMTISTVSIMPEALDTALTQPELLDLLAFLQSLNNEEWLLPDRRNSP